MRKMKNRIGLCLILAGMLMTVSQAQPAGAAVQYFQPGYAQRHNFNPALLPQWGYVGLPVVGNLNLTVGSNLGMADVLFPLSDGNLGTFLHPEVTNEQFLSNIRKKNRLNLDFNTSILSAGWFYGRSFWNFDIQLRGGLSANLPYEMFEFIKKEMYGNPSEYQIKDMTLAARAYMEIGLGYARTLNSEITVGGKFKFLVGLTEAEFRVDRMDIHLSDDAWKINSDANFRVFGRLLDVTPGEESIPDFGLGDLAPAGFGAAIDMGAEYKPAFLPGLRFSAAVTDLGFISYKKSDIQQYKANGEVLFEGFEEVGMDMNISDELESLTDDLLNMFTLEENPASKNTSRMINATLNLGAEYGFFGNRFSVGLLNTTTFYNTHTESELSLVANIHPARWFSVSLAYSFIGGREGLGWAVNITPKWGLNLFVASNYTPLKVSPQFIPLKRAHANIQVGLTIPLGNNRAYIYDREPQDVNAFPYSFRYPERHENKYKPEKFDDAGSDYEENRLNETEDDSYWDVPQESGIDSIDPEISETPAQTEDTESQFDPEEEEPSAIGTETDSDSPEEDLADPGTEEETLPQSAENVTEDNE